jgi:hypothetical protein
VEISRPCRCGETIQRIPCWKQGTSTEFICNKVCRALRNCGKHVCNRACCPLAHIVKVTKNKGRQSRTDVPTEGLSLHECDLTCSKLLNCGLHRYVLIKLASRQLNRVIADVSERTIKASVRPVCNLRSMRSAFDLLRGATDFNCFVDVVHLWKDHPHSSHPMRYPSHLQLPLQPPTTIMWTSKNIPYLSSGR